MDNQPVVLRLTRKVPAENNQFSDGGICTFSHGAIQDQFYFGWRDKSAISYPVGEAVQRALVLFNRYSYPEVTLVIEADLTEERKEMTLTIKPKS